MMPSVDYALRQKMEWEVVATLVHMRRLLRVRNQLRSPLLRLPTETILRILSFLMVDLDTYLDIYVWRSIYTTCHRTREIMRGATELWWKVNFARGRTAHFTLMRSKWNPRVIIFDLRLAFDRTLATAEKVIDYWRDKQGFRGNWLHTLEFSGSPSNFDHFSWILERSLPRLQRLKVHVTDSFNEDETDPPLPEPVALELPAGALLQVLDLRNIVLPWSSQSHLFHGLRELHLNFKDCDPVVFIPEDELFGIFDASPQLERLSLVRVGHEVLVEGDEPLPPKRVLQLPNLASLTLDNDPMVVKHTLAYMNLPVIASLEIRSFVSWDIAETLMDRLFPDECLLARLFPSPPKFTIREAGMEELDTSIEFIIGSIKLRFDFPLGQGERCRNIVMSYIPSVVPSSVTTLKLEYTVLDERGWRDFFTSHLEVRSIECMERFQKPVSRSLWDALSPTAEDTSVPCPRLEAIFVTSYTDDVVFTPLFNCLRNRETAGFKLRHLRMVDYHKIMANMYGFHEEFGPLVEVVEASKPDRFVQKVSPFSMCDLGIC